MAHTGSTSIVHAEPRATMNGLREQPYSCVPGFADGAGGINEAVERHPDHREVAKVAAHRGPGIAGQ